MLHRTSTSNRTTNNTVNNNGDNNTSNNNNYNTTLLMNHILFMTAMKRYDQRIIICRPGDDLFYFDPSPVGQDVIEGDSVTLRCDVSNRHLVVFYWTLDNKVLTNGSRRHQIDSNLRIARVDRTSDSGSFRCVATNVSTGAAVRSSVAVLNILCELM